MKKIDQETIAQSIIRDYNTTRIMFFFMWLITFIALVFVCVFTYNREREISTVETTEVQQENESGNNNYIGNDGDING